MTMQTVNGGWGTRARAMGLAAVRGLALTLVTLPGALLLSVLTLISISLVPIGIGAYTTPWNISDRYEDLNRVTSAIRNPL